MKKPLLALILIPYIYNSYSQDLRTNDSDKKSTGEEETVVEFSPGISIGYSF